MATQVHSRLSVSCAIRFLKIGTCALSKGLTFLLFLDNKNKLTGRKMAIPISPRFPSNPSLFPHYSPQNFDPPYHTFMHELRWVMLIPFNRDPQERYGKC